MRRSASGWPAALLMVASLHLLTTTGTWLSMDQGEYLLSAERLLHSHTFTLANVGERMPWARWARLDPEQPVRLRMHPATPLALAPLVALDETLGFGSPGRDGLLAHMQGHLFVLTALALLGLALRAGDASPGASAFAVAATGLSWPVWTASRNGGPEAILVALVAAFLLGGELVRQAPRRGAWLQASVLLLLPWVHATGPFVAAVLLAVEMTSARHGWRALGWISLALGAGMASQIAIWNWAYHGSWWAGGYALEMQTRTALLFGSQPFWPGLALYLSSVFLEGPVVALMAAAAARSTTGRRPLATGLLMCVTLSVLFATYHQPAPTRRLAPVWPLLGFAAARGWDALAPGRMSSRLLLASGGLVSFGWFMAVSGRHYQGMGGLFYPSVLWVRQLIEVGPGVLTIVPPVALLGALVFAAGRLDGELGSGRTRSGPRRVDEGRRSTIEAGWR